MADTPSKLHIVLKELVRRSNDYSKRLRILEQRGDMLENRINSLQSFMDEHSKQIQDSVSKIEKIVNKEDVKVSRMEDRLRQIGVYVKKLATTSKVRELEQLLEIYNPLKSNFTTKEEVQRIIEEKMSKQS